MEFVKDRIDGKPSILSPYLWLTLITTVLIWYLQYHRKRRYLHNHSQNIPGPKGWPLIGNILDFTGSSDDFYNIVMKHFTSYPGLTKAWYGSTLVYGISKPEYLESVLKNPNALHKMRNMYKFGESLVGYGLVTAPVPIWKRHRKIIMPAFNQKVLDNFVEIFVEKNTILSKHLETLIKKKEIDIFHIINRCNLDIICETAMGICVGAQSDNSAFGQWVDRVFEITYLRMLVIWYHFDFIFKWTSLHQEYYDLIEKIHAFLTKVINEKKANFSIEELPKRKVILDILLESLIEDKLTEKEIRDEVNTFIIAGTDTSAATVCFVLMMLGMHPDIQKKVYEEVTEILGSRSIEYGDLPHFKYTERVIKETLRLFPISPFILRDIKEEIRFKDDFVLAKDSSAVLGIMPLHRNGDIWPNPLKFDPDRFLPEEVSKRHPFAYLPFSGGPRNCVGPQYAMMAMKTTIASLIRKFKFSTSYQNVENIKLSMSLLLKPRDGFKITIKLRT